MSERLNTSPGHIWPNPFGYPVLPVMIGATSAAQAYEWWWNSLASYLEGCGNGPVTAAFLEICMFAYRHGLYEQFHLAVLRGH